MQRLVTLLCCVALTPLGLAEEDARSARAILDRAIEAMGGAKALSKPALSGSSRGTLEAVGNRSNVTNEWTVQGLDQLKWSSELTLNDNLVSIVVVLNKNQAWIQGNNNPSNEIDKEQTRPLQQGFAALRLAESLVPLTEKEWTLSSLGEIKFDTVTAIGIKAVKKGLPELDLYFDKKTHLPIRAEMRLTEQGGKDVPYVAKFANYKKIDERQCFTRLTVLREDKIVLEMERSDIKVLDRLDDDTFAKP